jgi:hypothetical protein
MPKAEDDRCDDAERIASLDARSKDGDAENGPRNRRHVKERRPEDVTAHPGTISENGRSPGVLIDLSTPAIGSGPDLFQAHLIGRFAISLGARFNSTCPPSPAADRPMPARNAGTSITVTCTSPPWGKTVIAPRVSELVQTTN